jgi:hypothetical protein
MADKEPMQASGAGDEPAAADGVDKAEAGGRSGGGESGGGAYKDDQTSGDGGQGGFMGHGGQSDIDYRGGGDKTDDNDNPNAPTDS